MEQQIAITQQNQENGQASRLRAPGTARGWMQPLYLLLTAVITITICSKSSPIYPLNDWVDSNCFLTVGKSMLHGLVPYRDLLEQKGPLLYMLHALAALVSDTSFLGVYFLEVAACFFYLYFGLKIIRLWLPRANVAAVSPLAALVYASSAFAHGDSAEEFCLPLLTFALYLALRTYRFDRTLSEREGLAVGVTSACVLWIKYTMLGFYFGWFVAMALWFAAHGKGRQLAAMTLDIAIGVMLPSILIVLYFTVNGAVGDLFTVYFYNNLFYYSKLDGASGSSFWGNLSKGWSSLVRYNALSLNLAVAGLLSLLGRKRARAAAALACMAVSSFVFVYLGGWTLRYYSFIFCAFAPVGMAAVYAAAAACLRCGAWVRTALACAVCALSIFLTWNNCPNTYLLAYEKSDLPQYQFAEIISQTEDATLLNYGFLDGGFYTVADIVPTCKYFCYLNIALPEIMQTQRAYVAQGRVDYVVTRNSELQAENYELVAQSTFPYDGSDYVYRLYRLIS